MKNESAETVFKREMMSCLPSLRAFAISLAGDRDRADDLIQETLLKAWAARDRFELGSNMQAWLITIFRNEFYSLMRKRRREVEDGDGAFLNRLAVNPSQDDHLSLQDFQAAVSQLVPEQREALLLVGASGFSYEKAAEICGCRPGTIKSRVSRARQHLRELMPDEVELKTSGNRDPPLGISPDRP
jgi:RNA polymerase sigma-70 factor, ECF subfamily